MPLFFLTLKELTLSEMSLKYKVYTCDESDVLPYEIIAHGLKVMFMENLFFRSLICYRSNPCSAEIRNALLLKSITLPQNWTWD